MHRPLNVSVVALALLAVPSVVAAQDLSDRKFLVSNIEVAEGTSYKVRAINWWGLSAVSFEQVKSVSRIHVEDVLDMSKVRETLEAVRTLYVANGYPKTSIVPRVRVLNGGHAVSVDFTVVEGTRAP